MGHLTPLKDRPRLFLDVETTGLDPKEHELLEIACVIDTPEGGVASFEWKVKPEHIETAQPRALEINGYTEEAWKDAKPVAEVLRLLVEHGKYAVIIGHRISFDMSFINEALKKAGIEERLDYHIIDTMTLAFEHIAPNGTTSISLQKCCDFLGIEPGNHTALADVTACRALYYKLIRASRWSRVWWRICAWCRTHLR